MIMARMYFCGPRDKKTIASSPHNIKIVDAFKQALVNNSVCPFLESSAAKYTTCHANDFSNRRIIDIKYFIYAFSVIFKKHFALESYENTEYYTERVHPKLNLWDDSYLPGELMVEKNIPTIVTVSADNNDENLPRTYHYYYDHNKVTNSDINTFIVNNLVFHKGVLGDELPRDFREDFFKQMYLQLYGSGSIYNGKSANMSLYGSTISASQEEFIMDIVENVIALRPLKCCHVGEDGYKFLQQNGIKNLITLLEKKWKCT